MTNKPINFIVKSIMIGDQNVGKTTLSKQMTQNIDIYVESSTIGVDFFALNTYINNSNVKLQIWDTAGNERFHNLIKLYFKNNAICYVVFDVCNESSFKNVKMWINEFKTNSVNPHVIIVVVANKIDIINKRVITYEQGMDMALLYDALYIEASSKTLIGLRRLIEDPLERLFDMYNNKIITASDITGLKDVKKEHQQLRHNTKTCCSIQ